MYELIKQHIKKTKPDFIVIEDVQFQKNFYVYSQLSQMQGMLFALFSELNMGFQIVPATKWKSFCGIKKAKRAIQKAETILFVKNKYKIDVSEDIADSIGLGTYFCGTYK